MRMNWEEQPAAIDTLVKMYPDHTTTEIAAVIGCKRYSVQKKAVAMGLERSAEFAARYGNLVKGRAAISLDHPERIIKKLGTGKLPEGPSLLGLLSALGESARKPKPTKRRYR